MANIKWAVSGDWEGGVEPGVNDVAVFDSASAAFTATKADSWGGVSFDGYANTFSRGAFDLTLGTYGFDSSGGVPGVVDLDSATVVNHGSANFTGFASTSNFLAPNATWVQKDGTEESPNVLTYRASSGAGATIKTFVFDVGSNTTVKTSGSTGTSIFWYMYNIQFNGTVNCLQSLWSLYGSSSGIKECGSTGKVTARTLAFYYGTLVDPFGNIDATVIQFRNLTGASGTSFQSPVTVMNTASASRAFTHCRFFNDLTFVASGAFAVTLDLSNSQVFGDVLSSGNALYTSSGTITLAGTADQALDFGSFANAAGLSAQKSAGDVHMIGGDIELMDDSDFGDKLDFSGFTGTFTGGSHEIRCKGFTLGDSVISGAVDLTDATVYNSGDHLVAPGGNASNYIVLRTKWYQSDGTRQNPNMFADNFSHTRQYQLYEFSEGSLTTLLTGFTTFPYDLIVSNKRLNIYGTVLSLENTSRFTAYGNATIDIGPNASIEGWSFRQDDATLIGHIANIKTEGIIFIRGVNNIGGVFSSPNVIFNIGANVKPRVFQNPTTFKGDVTFAHYGADREITVPVNCPGITFEGNVTSDLYDDQHVIFDNPITLGGGKTQTINFKPTVTALQIVANKQAGDIILATGSFNATGDLNLGEGALKFGPSYADTFTLGDNTLRCNGFECAPPTITGTINLNGGTVYNKGYTNLAGIPQATLLITTCTWYQESTNNEPWIDSPKRQFNNFILSEGCSMLMTATTAWLGPCRIDGTLELTSRFLAENSQAVITIGATGSVIGAGYIDIFAGRLQGRTENIAVTIRAMLGTMSGTLYNVLVIFTNIESTARTVRVDDGATFKKGISLEGGQAVTRPYNVILGACNIYASITATNPNAYACNVTGSITAADSVDQIFDLRSSGWTFSGALAINKPSGDLTWSVNESTPLLMAEGNTLFNNGYLVAEEDLAFNMKLVEGDGTYFEIDNLAVDQTFAHKSTATLVVKDTLSIRNRSVGYSSTYGLTLHNGDLVAALAYIGYNGVDLQLDNYSRESIILKPSVTIGWFNATAYNGTPNPFTIVLEGDSYAFDKSLGAGVVDDTTNGQWILTNTNERRWSRADWVDTVLTTASDRGQI